jgi:hypothetical protein
MAHFNQQGDKTLLNCTVNIMDCSVSIVAQLRITYNSHTVPTFLLLLKMLHLTRNNGKVNTICIAILQRSTEIHPR